MRPIFIPEWRKRHFFLAASFLAAAIALPLAARSQGAFTPDKWLESGLSEKMMGYRPSSLALSAEVPASLKKAPDGLAAPRYGSFQTGTGKNVLAHQVVVDFDDQGKPTRLYVDADGRGDLTATPPSVWTTKDYERPDGTKAATDYSSATLTLTADGKLRGKIEFYNSRSDAAKSAAPPPMIGYHTDCGVSGSLNLGGQTFTAIIADSAGTGQFSTGTEARSMPLMWVDFNGNGKTDRGETMLVGRPFEFDGKWWAGTNLTLEGAFQVVAAAKPEAPKPAVDLSPGKKAPAFTAKKLDGQEVKFPDAYRGKVVLLDFWATWCGPCVAELPNVVAAYGKYHDRGLEVLGISLDKENSEQKLADFTQRKSMPWPQVYDGKFWSAAVAKRYGINAIPHMILVDGDTGVILADRDIRGEALAPAIEKALAAKAK